MADRNNDDRLREIATSDPLVLAISAQMGEPSWADVRAIAAELLAARARIAKLEQEPPMALVDFGVGVNWKGLHEDMQRLRAERAAARNKIRADEEHLPTIASLTQDLYEAEQELATARADLAAAARVLPPCCGSLADAAQELVDERDAARAEVGRLRAELREVAAFKETVKWPKETNQ